MGKRARKAKASSLGRLRVVAQPGQALPCRATHAPLPGRALYGSDSTAGRVHPPAEVTGMRVVRQDRLGGLACKYAQVA